MSNLFDKKIEYIVSTLLSKYIQDNHPKFQEFIQVFLRYLDSEIVSKIYNIKENTNPNTVWSNLLDDYIDNYFKNVIDFDKFALNDDNKRTFLALSKFINNLKGNKKSIDFLFKSLSDFQTIDQGQTVSIDKIGIAYSEDESWWEDGDINYYNDVAVHDGSETYEANYSNPFTYRFTVTDEREGIINLINSIHPAGFQREFQSVLSFNDTQAIAEEATINALYYHFYDNSQTQHLYDGSITYSPTSGVVI